VALVPTFQQRQQASKAADQLQGFILGAKEMAKRDRLPTGIRLLPSANPNFSTEVQYIQQPDDFVLAQSLITVTVNNGVATATVLDTTTGKNVDFWGGYGAATASAIVQVGDYLELQGGGLLHQIAAVGPSNPQAQPPVGDQLTLASVPPNAIINGQQYRIIRSARPLQGEATLSLPQDTAIDLNWSYPQGVGAFDLLFSPSGTVVGGAAATDRVIYWVRDNSVDQPAAGAPVNGEPALIVVYVRTGFIAAHPVNTDPNIPSAGNQDYYWFTRDGRSSGL
jgi:hypothetical protein